MKIIGLTGGVASGKNFVAEIFFKKGAAVFDADAEVHGLLKSDKSTIEKVKKFFPESFIAKKIDRKILGKIVFSDEKKLKILEKIIHPEVRKNYKKFLTEAKKQKKKLAVLNIPLLLENKGYKCDYVVAIILPKKIQKERFLAREKEKHPAATIAELSKKFEQIRRKQIGTLQRKNCSDFVLNNSGDLKKSVHQVNKLLQQIL